MKAIPKVLLGAKSWQIFLVMVAFVASAAAAMLWSIRVTPPGDFPSTTRFLAVMELLAISFALWLWSIGTLLNSVIPQQLRMRSAFFRFSIIYLPLYLPIFGVFLEGQHLTRKASLILISLAFIFPLHLLAIFCQFYSWYFVSKGLALAENSRPVLLSDYLGYFVGIWILPVGIWIVQPRVNRLYANATQRLSS